MISNCNGCATCWIMNGYLSTMNPIRLFYKRSWLVGKCAALKELVWNFMLFANFTHARRHISTFPSWKHELDIFIGYNYFVTFLFQHLSASSLALRDIQCYRYICFHSDSTVVWGAIWLSLSPCTVITLILLNYSESYILHLDDNKAGCDLILLRRIPCLDI